MFQSFFEYVCKSALALQLGLKQKSLIGVTLLPNTASLIFFFLKWKKKRFFECLKCLMFNIFFLELCLNIQPEISSQNKKSYKLNQQSIHI